AHLLARMLSESPAAAQCEAQAAIAVGGDILAVVRRPEQIEARGDVAIQEIRLGEAEIDQGAQGAERQAEAQILALAEQVALTDRDVTQDAGGRRETGAERDFAGAL